MFVHVYTVRTVRWGNKMALGTKLSKQDWLLLSEAEMHLRRMMTLVVVVVVL